jgi:hypothetical protein
MWETPLLGLMTGTSVVVTPTLQNYEQCKDVSVYVGTIGLQ